MLFKNIVIRALLLFIPSNFCTAENSKKDVVISPELKEFIDNFKAVSMHFIEPFLKDIKVKDLQMEGFVADDLTPIVAKFMKISALNTKDKDMETFANRLEASFDVSSEAYKLRADNDGKFRSFYDLENRIFPSYKNGYTAFPAGWLGPSAHGILLIIENSGFNLFNLIVINTGLGLDYHSSTGDSKNFIAPLVYRVWKRFNNIPKVEFTKGNNWFIQALGLLRDPLEMIRAIHDDYKPEKHFYETILGNFEKYKAEAADSKDNRYLVGQHSGSCAYSSLTAGLLYISKNNEEFLTRKFMYGMTLLQDFLDKYEKLDITKSILGDAYEPMSRYLMKHLASGIAFQTIEFLESSGIDLRYANLLGRNIGSTVPSLQMLKSFKYINEINSVVQYAVRIHKLLVDIKIDKTTAAIVYEDMSKYSPERIPKTVFNRAMLSLTKEDLEKLKIDENNWPGIKHNYISSESDYTKFFPKTFSSATDLARKLEEIAEKSGKKIHLNAIMNIYVYDFFKIARSSINKLIGQASYQSCSLILKSSSKIMRHFIENSNSAMAVEDLAAMTQLLLLTWKAALRADSMSARPLGFSQFSAPISRDLLVQMTTNNDPFDPNGALIKNVVLGVDTCAAAPAWLTTEDEYDAWIMFEEAKLELSADKRQSIYDPTTIFPCVDNPYACANTVLPSYSAFEILKRIANEVDKSPLTRGSIASFANIFNDVSLAGPYLIFRGLFTDKEYPQFHYLIDVATYFYFGPWWRPFGPSNEYGDITFAQFYVYEMVFGPFIGTSDKFDKEQLKVPPFLRKVAVNELLEYRKLALKTSPNPDFALNQFADVRAAAAMQYSQTEIRFYAFLSLIEGAKSCVFFENSPLVFMADRLLGFKQYFVDDLNLIKRTHEALRSMIFNELAYFKGKHELLDLTKKEKLLDRIINASLVYVRFIVRLESWTLPASALKSKDMIESLAKVYDEWAPMGHLKSNFEISEDMVGKINLLLWDCVNSGKNFKDFGLFSRTFISNLSEYKTNVDAEDIVKAHVSYRYFVAAAFSKQRIPSKEFDILTKIYLKLRVPSKLSSKNSAEKALKLIAMEMVNYFEPTKTDLDNDWDYKIDDNFEFIEIKRKDSMSKIPFVILRISTGRILFNGVAVIHKSKIYNHPIFRQFFSKEDLSYARNGVIKPIGDKIGYSLSGFRGTGQNFLFITNGEDTLLDIFYYHEKDRWLWSNPDNKSTKAFLRPLRLMNIDGIRIYQKYHEEKHLLEAIFMKGAEYEPLYRLTIENIDKPEISEIKIKLPFIEKPVLLLTSKEAKEKLNKVFKGFSDPEFISVYRTEDNRAVIMYGPYRFAKEEVPLIFEEKIDESDPKNKKQMFVLLNHDNWCIDEDQTIVTDWIFQGTIKMRSISDPDSKAILLPNFQLKEEDDIVKKEKKRKNEVKEKNKKKNDYDDDKYLELSSDLIIVEIIKIGKADLMPKDRYEKLVLAYKLMLNFETSMARKLLHPIQSIDQNSPFNDEELKMLDWILKLPNTNPEITALKMMTVAHFYINSFNYIAIRKKKLPDNVSKIASKYLSSLRQISNKFYLHRTFPEVIENDDLFNRLFVSSSASVIKFNSLNLAANDPETHRAFVSKVDAILRAAADKKEVMKPEGFDLNFFNWRKINYILKLDENNFWYLFALIKNNDNALNYYQIHYRRNEVPLTIKSTLDSFDFELLLYCAKDNESLRKSLYKLASEGHTLFSTMSQPEQDTIKLEFLNCIKSSRNENIRKIVQPIDHSIIKTDIKLTRDVFINDLKEKIINDIFAVPAETYVTPEVSQLVDNLIKEISTFSTNETKKTHNNANVKVPFEEISNSLVLAKLVRSISQFNSPDSIDGSIEIDLQSAETKNIFDNLAKLQGLLKTCIGTLDNDINNLTAELVEKTSTEKMTDDSNLITKLSNSNHFKKSKTFASLYGCYYALSWECFIKKFPHINELDAKNLMDKTRIFYSNNVLQDYYNFLIEKTKTLIEAKSVSLDDLSDFVVEAKKLEKFNDRIKNPGILNFEFRSKKFRLREEQTKDLELLTTKDSSGKMFNSIVIQRMMAAGKTLVLGTLATVLKARESDILSILVPPSSLFQSNSASMQSRTYNYFKSRGTVLNFERVPLPTTEKAADSVLLFLKWFNDNLKITLKARNYLVMSPDSLQSFLNSYIEFLNYYTSVDGKVPFKDDAIKSVLKSYAEIYDTFLTKSSIILDEIDMTMNPKKELNYPTTNRENYNLIAVALTTDLIEFSIFSKDIMKQNLNIMRNNQAGLTSTAYENIKKIWLDYIKTSLDDEKSLWNRKLLNPIHSELTKDNIIKFMECDDISSYATWVDSIKSSNDNLLQLKAIIIMKRQIDDFLQDALKSTVKEHFGPAGPSRPSIKFAVPYVAANTPSESSLFADRWETLNKSLLMTAVIGLNESDYVDFILWLKEQVNIESISTGSAKITATYENFSSLISDLNPLSIDIENPVQMKLVLSELDKKNRAAIRLLFSFYLDTVIAKLEFPTEQITSNALHMSSMFASVQGYSGTIDNINILPSEVVANAYKDHISNEKNNGGIVQKLILDSIDKKEVAIVNGMDSVKSCRNNVKSVLKAISKTDQVNLTALIDVGAFFKNFRNAKVAESLLRINSPRIKCVLYYDENTNMLQYVVEKIKLKEDSSSSGVSDSGLVSSKPEYTKKWEFNHGKLALSDPDSITKTTGHGLSERFTFYDQRHITGSDILQPPNAMALLTFGSRNLLRDILQGALRMRQFMTSQKVFFAITPDVVSYYNSLLSKNLKILSTSNVIALSAFNEDEKQGRENGALSFVKIDVKIRSQILKEITEKIKADRFTDILKPFKNSRSLFIRNFSENPLLWIKERKTTTAKDALLKFIDSREKMKIDKVHTDALAPLIEDCDRKTLVTQSLLCFAPEKLPEFEDDMLMSSEMQLELNSLQLNEFELESVNEDSNFKDVAIHYPRFRLNQCNFLHFNHFNHFNNIISYNQIIQHKDLDKKMKNAIEESLIKKDLDRIWFSRDLVNIVHSSPKICPYNLFGSFNLEGTHIFIAKNNDSNNPFNVMLVSNDVAEQIRKDSTDGISPSCQEWVLTDLMGNIVAKGGSSSFEKNDNILNVDQQFREQIFNLLIINGSLLQLTSQPVLKEIFFKKWVRNQGVNGGLAFLMSRMRVLQNKLRFVFDPEDPLITTISKIINGDTVAADNLADETYDSNSESMKKLEQAKSAEALKSATLHRAQGIYDKISIKTDLQNPGLIYINNNYDEISDSGSVSSSDNENESESGGYGGTIVDMLDSSELDKIIADKTIHGNTPSSDKPSGYGGSGDAGGSSGPSEPSGPSLSESSDSHNSFAVFIVLISAAGIAAGVYYYFFRSDTENKIESEMVSKKDDESHDDYGNSKKQIYESTDINPPHDVDINSAYNTHSTYYNSYDSANNNNSYYNANSGYNSYGYNSAGYNSSGYFNAGYNTGNNNSNYNNSYNQNYNNDQSYNNAYSTGYNNNNYANTDYNNSYNNYSSTYDNGSTSGYNSTIQIGQPDYNQKVSSSSPPEYGQNNDDKVDDFKLPEKH